VALIGCIVAALGISGLDIKFTTIVGILSGDNLLIALLLTAVAVIVLGMGMPTTAAYIVAATVASPVLIKLGVPLIQAHFFIFYYSVASMLTPPVAMGSLVAAHLAGSKYWATCFEACKIASTAYILPLIFIFGPVILLQSDPVITVATVISGIAVLVSTLMIVLAILMGSLKFFVAPYNLIQRLSLFISAIILFIFVYSHNYIWFFIGLFLFGIPVLWNLRAAKTSVSEYGT
jgi:TRAP-type uncharacterized transport system fused permease subunit